MRRVLSEVGIGAQSQYHFDHGKRAERFGRFDSFLAARTRGQTGLASFCKMGRPGYVCELLCDQNFQEPVKSLIRLPTANICRHIGHRICRTGPSFTRATSRAIATSVHVKIKPGCRTLSSNGQTADNSSSEAILQQTQQQARAIIADDPDLADPALTRLRQLVLLRYGQALEISDVG